MKGHIKTVAIGLAVSLLAIYLVNKSAKLKSIVGG